MPESEAAHGLPSPCERVCFAAPALLSTSVALDVARLLSHKQSPERERDCMRSRREHATCLLLCLLLRQGKCETRPTSLHTKCRAPVPCVFHCAAVGPPMNSAALRKHYQRLAVGSSDFAPATCSGGSIPIACARTHAPASLPTGGKDAVPPAASPARQCGLTRGGLLLHFHCAHGRPRSWRGTNSHTVANRRSGGLLCS